MIDTVVEPLPFGGFCGKVKEDCGHSCKGVANERRCLPCIDPVCTDGVNETELCGICYTSELGEEPCSKLRCGHLFHTNCIVQLLKHGHATLRLSFAFMSCPACKAPIDVFDCEPIAAELRPLIKMKHFVQKEALKHAREQGILADGRVETEGDPYYNKPLEYALHRCTFYKCNECHKPYFGGLIDC